VFDCVGLVAAATTVHALAYDPFSDPGCWQVCEPIALVITTVGLRKSSVCARFDAARRMCRGRRHRIGPAGAVAGARAALSAVALIAIATAIPWLRWGSTAHPTIDDVLRMSWWPA
jgi:hypothetical protein